MPMLMVDLDVSHLSENGGLNNYSNHTVQTAIKNYNHIYQK